MRRESRSFLNTNVQAFKVGTTKRSAIYRGSPSVALARLQHDPDPLIAQKNKMAPSAPSRRRGPQMT